MLNYDEKFNEIVQYLRLTDLKFNATVKLKFFERKVCKRLGVLLVTVGVVLFVLLTGSVDTLNSFSQFLPLFAFSFIVAGMYFLTSYRPLSSYEKLIKGILPLKPYDY